MAQVTVGFGASDLSGATSFLSTSLQWGPDDRLYVAQQDGLIKAYSILRLGPNNYIVTATEDITQIQSIPNHNDDGSLAPDVVTRQITGIMVTGTAANPVIWASSSDPRIGGGTLGSDIDLDTNSGMISRLTWDGSAWVKEDIVRGLPRSEENHASNGMVLDTVNNIIYLAQGGNTNMGARSNNFAFAPEFSLSAAILSIDLNAIASFPYDLPTLDDEDRPGTIDSNDPFGGNDGKNQALLVDGGPVQVYAPGFRNPYDILITESGRMYTWDNGPNAGWGDEPSTCLDSVIEEGGPTLTDALHYIPGPGYYGGHPNLVRANIANTFNDSNPQSPVPASLENPIECTYLEPVVENDALVLHPASSNGLCEYTASNFDSAMVGYLLCATFDGKVVQVELNETGDSLGASGKTTLIAGFGSVPLDVVAMGDDGPFPGTIWTANIFGMAPISVFEPNDYDGGSGAVCDFTDPLIDSDADGYTNGDEIDNATNPCSAASKPADNDLDGVSDLNDPDDDNDGIPDVMDAFALDSLNGSATYMPLDYNWEPGDDPLGGFFNLGFTGIMNNGVTDYLDQYNINDITAGGTAGLFTIDAMTAGGSKGINNTQDNAFQFGINVDTVTQPFVLEARIRAPFAGFTPADFQSMGFFFGTGDMDNYAKLVVSSNGGLGGIQFLLEEDTVAYSSPITKTYDVAVLGATTVDLFMTIDPIALTVQPAYSLNGGPQVDLDGARNIPASWVDSILALGIIGTSTGATEFPATWDYIRAEPLGPKPSAQVTVTAGNFLSSDILFSNSWSVTNTSNNAGDITEMVIDLTNAIQQDFVFDPTGAAGDHVFQDLIIDSGSVETGFIGHTFEAARDGGWDRLVMTFSDFNPGETLEFSIDIDPTSIQGLFSPGPGNSGKVAGTEMTGTRIDLTYNDSLFVGGQLFHDFGTFGSASNRIDADTLETVTIAMLGIDTLPTQIAEPNQTIRISGVAGAAVKLFQAEGGMFLNGNPGFDIDSFESNNIIDFTEYSSTIGLEGYVDVPVVLTRNDVSGGLNHFVAVIDGGSKTSDLSNKLIAEFAFDTAYTEIAINANGLDYVAEDGTEFVSDVFFTNSSVFTNNTITDILGTNDDEIFRSERVDFNFAYEIPVVNGDYELDLYFAEIFFGAAGGTTGGSGLRVFNVSVEGTEVISNLDIYDTVGAETALIITVPVTVDDEFLNINFTSVTNKAKISGIVLREQGCTNPENITVSPTSNSVSFSWDAVDDAFGYQLAGRPLGAPNLKYLVVTGTSKNVTGLSPSTSYEWAIRTGCPGDTTDFTPFDTFATLTLKEEGILAALEEMQLSPNPATQVSMLSFTVNEEADAEVRILDLAGREVLTRQLSTMSGNNQYELTLTDLESGLYIVELNFQGHKTQQRLQITK
jgi:hypothetical protein